VERIIVVILLDVIAVEALDIKESAMEELELFSRMIRALGETCNE
jgi:hypothetical protein